MATRRGHRAGRIAGAFASIIGASMLLWGSIAPSAHGVFSTNLSADAGQSPMPSAVTDVPENCKGIAPTPGSKNNVTQKQLNDGQGIVKPGPNDFDPGGTVHFLVKYNPTNKSASFDIRDCVVVFLPGNKYIDDVLALIDPAGHGQIIPAPGSTPAIKGYDDVIDDAQFVFPDDVALPGEFDLSWTVPSDAPPGALICNYAKDTGGSNAGGKENRKAGGACFSVPEPPTTTSTTAAPPPPPLSTTSTAPPPTSTPESTTTSEAPTTTTTTTTPEASTTTTPASTTTSIQTLVLGEQITSTTIPTVVLGEQFNKDLAFTGGNTRGVVAVAGAMILTGGLLLLAASRGRGLRAYARR